MSERVKSEDSPKIDSDINNILLSIKNLDVFFKTSQGEVQALRDVCLSLNKGESLGIVGESGSGKSVTSLAVFDLLADNAKIHRGEISFKQKDILKMEESEKRKLRGDKIAMIFQDPMSSLNPCFTVEAQLSEVLRVHRGSSKKDSRQKIIELLKAVGIAEPEMKMKCYPHELSGGMNQRVMIAMALALDPEVLVADEPTTALDVTIQKQILDLLKSLQKKRGMALILVSHDIGLISQYTDRTAVMYAGEIIEEGVTQEVILNPLHPYTKGLLSSLPSRYREFHKDFRLPVIAGLVPALSNRPPGCQLAPRCAFKKSSCEEGSIPLKASGETRKIRCIRWQDLPR